MKFVRWYYFAKSSNLVVHDLLPESLHKVVHEPDVVSNRESNERRFVRSEEVVHISPVHRLARQALRVGVGGVGWGLVICFLFLFFVIYFDTKSQAFRSFFLGYVRNIWVFGFCQISLRKKI